jgi:hypothetical protein
MEPGAICNQPEIIEIFNNQKKRNAIRIFTENGKTRICFNYMITQRNLEHE